MHKFLANRSLCVLVACLAVIAGSVTLNAATVTWDGGGTDNNFNTAANWAGDVVPAVNSDLVFAGTVRTTPSYNGASGNDYNSITFAAGASAFTFSSTNSARLDLLYGVTNSSSNDQTVSAVLGLKAGSHVIATGATGKNLTLSGAISDESSAAPGGLEIQANTGTVYLNAANTFTGGVTLTSGTLQLGNAAALGAYKSGAVNVVNGGTLNVNSSSANSYTLANSLTGAGGSVTDNSSGTNLSTLAVLSTSGTSSYAGVIKNGSTRTLALQKLGGATLELTGVSTYSGPTRITDGTLRLVFGSNSNVVNASSRLVFDGSGTLQLRGTAAAAKSQAFGGTLLSLGAGATVDIDNNGGTSTTVDLGTLIRTTGSALQVKATSGTLGTEAVIKAAGAANDSTGIVGGWAVAGSDWASQSGGNLVSYASTGGTLQTLDAASADDSNYLLGGSLTRTAAGAIHTLKIDNTASGSLDLGGTQLTLRAGGLLYTGTAAYAINNGGLAGSIGGDLVVHALGSGPLTIGGSIGDNVAATNLVKTGSGTLVLSGTNSYTGNTVVAAGTLKAANGALPSALGVGTVYLGQSATLDLAGVSLAVGGLSGNGAVNNSSATAATLTIGSNGLDSVLGGGAGTLGVISNSGGALSLVKTGAGQLTLNGNNTFTGTLTIEQGSVVLGATTAFGTATGATVVKQGASLNLNGFYGASAYAETVSIAGSGANGQGALINTGSGLINVGVTVKLTADATIGGPSRFDLSGLGGRYTLTKEGASENAFFSGSDIGTIVINAGYVTAIASSTALGDSTYGTIVNRGGTLNLYSGLTWSEPLELVGGVFSTSNGAHVWNGTTTLSARSFVSANSGYSIRFAGKITGAAGFVKLGPGTIQLDSNTNDYRGDTTVAAGTLKLGGNDAIPNGVGKGNLVLHNLWGGPAGTLDLGGFNDTVNALIADAGSSFSMVTNSTTGTAKTLTFGDADITSVFKGKLTGTGSGMGSLAIVKIGAGTVALQGTTNDYAGGTTLSAGELQFLSGALGTTGNVAFTSSARLTWGAGNTQDLSARLTSVASAATATLDTGANAVVFATGLNWAGSLAKAGGGSLTFNAANTLAGVNVVGGTLGSTVASGSPFGTGPISLNAAMSLAPGGSGSAVALTAASAAGATFSYGSAAQLALGKGSQTSLALTVGPGGAVDVLSRIGRGTLILAPTAVANLGVSEKVIISGNAPATVNGMATAAIVTAAAGGSADFVAYDNTNGFLPVTYDLIDSFAGATKASKVKIIASQLLSSSALAYALRSDAALSLDTGVLLTLGNGSGQAGLVLNGGSLTPSAGATGTGLDFGAAEAVVYTSSAGGTIDTALHGSGGLTKFGPGSLVLTTASDYTGGTVINAGGIRFANGSLAQGNVTFGGNATLQWAAGNVEDISNRLQAIAASVTATLDVGANNVTFASGLAGAGSIVKTGSGTLTLSAPHNGQAGAVMINQGSLQLAADGALGPTATVTLADVASAVFDVNGRTQTLAQLSGGGSTGGNVTLGNGSLTVGDGFNPTFAGKISGSASSALTKTGAGTWVVTGDNSGMLGQVNVNQGVLQLSRTAADSKALGAGNVVNVNNGGTIYQTVTNQIADNATVNVATGGLWRLADVGETIAMLTGNGEVNWGAASMTVRLNGASGEFSGQLRSNATSALNVGVSGGGGLGGTWFLSGNNGSESTSGRNFDASIYVLSGTLKIGHYLSLGSQSYGTVLRKTTATGGTATRGTLDLNGVSVYSESLTFDAESGAAGSDGGILTNSNTSATALWTGSITLTKDGTILGPGDIRTTGIVSGGGKLIKQGTGTLLLLGNNSYTGGTVLDGGTIAFSTTGLGLQGSITFNSNSTLQWFDANNQLDISGRLAAIPAGVVATFDTRANDVAFASGLSGAGGIAKTGNGTLSLYGASSYGGDTVVSGGSLQLVGANRLPTTTKVTLANAAGVLLDIGESSQQIGSLAGGGAAGGTVNVSGAAVLTVGNASSTQFDGTVTGTGSLAKVGTGTLTMAGANNYRGTTTVSAGTLAVNGSHTAAGQYSVGSDGTLAGTGSIATANADVQVAGTLSPGNSAGTLSFDFSAGAGKLLFQSGSQLDFELGASSDLIRFVGPAGDYLAGSGNATLNLILGAGFDYGSSYTIFNNVTTSGFSFASIAGYDTTNYQASLVQTGGNSYDVQFTNVPEPSTIAMLVGAGLLGGLTWWRRRNQRSQEQ